MLFADVKAFDKVNRDKLWKILKKKGVKEQVVRRIQKIYEETEVMVRNKARLHGNLQDKERSKAGLCNETTPV